MKQQMMAAMVTTLLALAGCVNVPQYHEVTELDDGVLVVTRDSIDAFESDRAVDNVAAEYCGNRGERYEVVDRSNQYVNKAGDAVFRVTLKFRCADHDTSAGEDTASEPAKEP